MVKNGLSEQKFGMFQPKVENRDVEFEKSIPSQWSHPAPGDSPSHNTVFCHHDVVFQRPIRYDSLRKLWGEYTGRFYCIRSTKAGTQQERLSISLTNGLFVYVGRGHHSLSVSVSRFPSLVLLFVRYSPYKGVVVLSWLLESPLVWE